MKKEYCTYKVDGSITIELIRDCIRSFMQLNKGLEPTALIVSLGQYNEIIDQYMKWNMSLSAADRAYNNDFDKIIINGIEIRLIGTPYIKDYLFEMH